jgi:hypothetical protein
MENPTSSHVDKELFTSPESLRSSDEDSRKRVRESAPAAPPLVDAATHLSEKSDKRAGSYTSVRQRETLRASPTVPKSNFSSSLPIAVGTGSNKFSSKPRKVETNETFVDFVIRDREKHMNVHCNSDKVPTASKPARKVTASEKHLTIQKDHIGQLKGNTNESRVVLKIFQL